MLRNLKRMASKKGQGISLNVIIVAAIGLIVLVVLTFIFLNQTGKFGIGINKCVDKGAECYNSKCPSGYQALSTLSAKCYDSDNEVEKSKVCCIRLE